MEYWIIINGVPCGPKSLEQVLTEPTLGADTPVWHKGLTDWTVAQQVPEIAMRMNGQMPPVMPQPPVMPVEPPVGNGQNQYQPWQQGPYQQQQPWQQGYQQRPYNPYEHMPADPRNHEPMPSSNLVWAILSTLCCCLPLGVVAIYYASQVQSAFMRGDRYQAMKYSQRALLWSIISAVAGLIWAPLYMAYVLMCS